MPIHKHCVRRRIEVGLLVVVFAVTLASCQPSTADEGYVEGQCLPTIPTDEFIPPEPYLPSRAADELRWYGSDEIWTALDINGEHSPRKSVWWSKNFPGGTVEEAPEILVTWTRLDSAEPEISNDSLGTNAYTQSDGWFMIGGIDPDFGGCWRVVATYKGASMSYVYEPS